MTTSQLHEFARIGAEARLRAIADEQQAIFTVFPELRDGAAPARLASAPARRHRRMSAAQRKAVGARMKRYWAKRRAEKATAQKAATKRSARAACPQRPGRRRASG